jgi:hypothetical protein
MGDEDKAASGDFGLNIEEDSVSILQNRRAAVIIGIGTSADLPRLSSAGPTARGIGKWLSDTSPGYDVTVITDEEGHEVTRAEIFKAISSYVTVPIKYELLLVHYIGHGLYQHRDDIWMLSDLPVDPAACISLAAVLNDAKFCGIPNVVVVSDACRTLPGDVRLSNVDPSTIIPQHEEFLEETSCVDYIKATGRGLPAFEGEIDGERHSFLSHALREAYRQPFPQMILSLDASNGTTITVVPNRKLSPFLDSLVVEKLGEIDATKKQTVVCVTPSADNIFIAPVDLAEQHFTKIQTDAPSRPQVPSRKRKRTGADPQSTQDKNKRRTRGSTSYNQRFDISRLYGTEIDFLLERAKFARGVYGNSGLSLGYLRFKNGEYQESGFDTGINVTGARIARAAMTTSPDRGRYNLHFSQNGPDDIYFTRLPSMLAKVGEVALSFEDGRCVLLPVIEGYICHVAVNDIGTHSIAYIPSKPTQLYQESIHRLEDIERLRPLVNKAMDNNRFHVGSNADAAKLADAIRVEKAIDPILGLLAAQAYAEAGMSDRVRNVSMYMNRDIAADLFDVRLLSNRFWQDKPEVPVVPRCPMLTQNWALLNARRAELSPTVATLRPFLTDALWTTFAPGAAEILFDAIEKGNF